MMLLAFWTVVGECSTCKGVPGDWQLVWSDEFDGSSLDTDKWDATDWTTPHNNERQAYHPSRVTIEGGNLVLTADDADYGGKSYTSGKVVSKWAQQYGRWEVCAKLPGTRGTWPAIWLLPDTKKYRWPSQGEIDIMESRGDKPTKITSAFHWGPNAQGRKFLTDHLNLSRGSQPIDFTNGFHLYAVEWESHELRFYVNEVHHYTIRDTDTGGFLSGQSAPMEVQLNIAVGGDYVGDAQPDENSVWPQKMLVDYVRVYVQEAGTAPALKSRNRSIQQVTPYKKTNAP